MDENIASVGLAVGGEVLGRAERDLNGSAVRGALVVGRNDGVGTTGFAVYVGAAEGKKRAPLASDPRPKNTDCILP